MSIAIATADRPPVDFGLQGVAMKIAVGKAEIEFLDSGLSYVEKPMNPHKGFEELEQTGTVTKFRVTTTDDLDMIFGLVSWPHANLEVRHLETIDGLGKYKRLAQAGRMGFSVHQEKYWYAELRAMKRSKKVWATLNQVSLAELSEMLEGDAEKLLSDSGVLKIGSKAELAGDTSNRKNLLSFMCEIGNETAIAVAFTLSRVLPIMYDFGLSEEQD